MIIIDLAQAVALARARDIQINDEIASIETAMQDLGAQLAADLGVELHSAVIEEPEFAGAALCFTGAPGTCCPEELQALDPDGELACTDENPHAYANT